MKKGKKIKFGLFPKEGVTIEQLAQIQERYPDLVWLGRSFDYIAETTGMALPTLYYYHARGIIEDPQGRHVARGFYLSDYAKVKKIKRTEDKVDL